MACYAVHMEREMMALCTKRMCICTKLTRLRTDFPEFLWGVTGVVYGGEDHGELLTP